MPEIDVGEFSEALNDKMDRDCNNSASNAFNNLARDASIDYVVSWRMPTSSDRRWYRLYKSGWIEQGGIVNANTGTSGTITFLKAMANTDYSWMSVLSNDAANNFFVLNWSLARTTTTIGWYKSANSVYGSWMICGQAAT